MAQTFSAYEWIVSPVPLREDSVDSQVSIRPTSDFETFNADAGGVRMLPKAGKEDLDLSLDDLEINIAPILQPLRRLAEATTGESLRLQSDFEEKLERLQELWRAYYLTNRPFDGAIRPTAARFVRNPWSDTTDDVCDVFTERTWLGFCWGHYNAEGEEVIASLVYDKLQRMAIAGN